MRRRNTDRDPPLWVDTLDDTELVEKFKLITDSAYFDYKTIGQKMVDMRKRLLKILIDGLAAKEQVR